VAATLFCEIFRGGERFVSKNLLQMVEMEHESNVHKKVALGATIGLTVGFIAGVLLAPKAGKETRNDLVKNFQELPDKAKELSGRAQEMLEEEKEKATDEYKSLYVGVKGKVSDITNEIHDGIKHKINR